MKPPGLSPHRRVSPGPKRPPLKRSAKAPGSRFKARASKCVTVHFLSTPGPKGHASGFGLSRPRSLEELLEVRVAKVNTRICKEGKHASVKLAEGYDAEETALKLGAF